MPGFEQVERLSDGDVTTAPRFDLSGEQQDIAHLVCCRDESWETALCGVQNDTVALNASSVCTMCFEVATSLLGRNPLEEPIVCFRSGRPCPDEHEIDLRILGEVT